MAKEDSKKVYIYARTRRKTQQDCMASLFPKVEEKDLASLHGC